MGAAEASKIGALAIGFFAAASKDRDGVAELFSLEEGGVELADATDCAFEPMLAGEMEGLDVATSTEPSVVTDLAER